MAGICVRYSSPEFTAAKRDYGASNLETASAINGYLNNYNTHEIGSDAYNKFMDTYGDHAEYKQYLDHWFRRGNNDVISDTDYYNQKHADWIEVQKELRGTFSQQEALNLLKGTENSETRVGREGLEVMFGEENVKAYLNDNGEYIIRVAEPKLASESVQPFIPKVRELTPFQEAQEIAENIIAESEARVKFYEDGHKYAIDGEGTDINVTSMDNVSIDINPLWSDPSQAIGNVNDSLVRDYFSDEGLKSSYPNMNSADIEYFKIGFDQVKEYLDKRYPEGYKVYPRGVRVFAEVTDVGLDGKPRTRLAAGTLDLLIASADGKLHVLDAKSSRSGQVHRDMTTHSRQMRRYSNMAQAQNPAAQGRFGDHIVIASNVHYPDPTAPLNESLTIQEMKDNPDYEKRWIYRRDADTDQLYITDNLNPELGERRIQDLATDPYSQNPGEYVAPHIRMDNAIYEDTDYQTELLETYDRLDPETKRLLGDKPATDEFVTIKDGLDILAREQREAIHDPNNIPIKDRVFLLNNVMNYYSMIISQLGESNQAAYIYLPEGKYDQYDFTEMSREQILDTVDINDVLDFVRETFYNPNRRVNEGLSEQALNELGIMYDNWHAVIESANRHLFKLEDINIDKVTEVDLEHGDFGVNEMFEMATIEQSIKEHWQQGYRHISARSGLALQVRRVFERLRNVDQNQNDILHDKYKMQTFIDGGKAINQVFAWTKGATSLELMIEALEKRVKHNPWVQQVIDKIQEEPFRSAFFRNFRKDQLVYGIVMQEFDDLGNRIYKTHTINTMGAKDTMLDVISGKFRDGLMGKLLISKRGHLEGEGQTNTTHVSKIQKAVDLLRNDLLGLTGKEFHDAIEKNKPRIRAMLSEIGFTIEMDTLEAFLNEDSDANNLGQMQLDRVFTQIDYLLRALQNNSDMKEYLPMKPRSKGNVVSSYNRIADMLSKHIETHVEASSFENGKMYYSFVTPSYLGKLISRLGNELNLGSEAYNKFTQEEYGRYRWFKSEGKWNTPWLQMLEDSEKNKEMFSHKVQLNFDKVDYKDLSELSYTLSLMSEYFYDSDGRWAWYRLPIMSDKPSSEFVRFRRFSEVDYKDQITQKMENVFHQELMRIKTVLERSANKLNEDLYPDRATNAETIRYFDAYNELSKPENAKLAEKIRDGKKLTHSDLVRDGKFILANTGASFKFLNMFNDNIVRNDEMGKLIIRDLNGELTNDKQLINEVFNRDSSIKQDGESSDAVSFKDHMAEIFKGEQAVWEQIGLYETFNERQLDPVKREKGTEGKLNLKYLKAFADQVSAIEYQDGQEVSEQQRLLDKANKALEEYFWNDYFATVNLIQLTVTDLAYSENMEDFQKRYSQVHSPSMRLNTTATFDLNGKSIRYSDGISRTMYIADNFIISEMRDNLKQIFDDKIESGEMTAGEAANILSKYGYHTDIIEGKKYVKYEEGGNEILVPTQEIDVTDGQAYSSLTSYRKKLGMGGEWAKAMEKAYNTIREGRWKGQDLDVIWQPLKGFVYTQITKATGAKLMAELKIPTQHKNSEYLLLMADAIIRDAQGKTGFKSKLNAIYDFMEESAYTNGEYNQRGIDTIQYASAVKQGLTGIVDLNQAQTYEQALTMLREAAYGDNASQTATRNPDNYNDGLVHSFSFEDYGIQQNVPAGMVDSDIMLGSQMRVLSMSDFSINSMFDVKGETLTTRELQNQYQKLIADNIKDSYDQLMKDLQITEGLDNIKEKNERISKLLMEQVMKDQRYSTDLIRALETIDGEFVIPLSESMHSTRIQQLLNAIIKDRIVKQRTHGGSRVQVTVSGLSRGLNVVFKDSKGKILLSKSEFTGTDAQYRQYIKENQHSVAYLETLISIPTQEMTDALTKEDGTLMTVEEALRNGVISEEQLKGIAYRIPTEDKYSIFPTKAVGFVPKAAGEVIILPAEITTISGADFDIDKMYVSIKSFRHQNLQSESEIRNEVSKEYNKGIKDGSIDSEVEFSKYYADNKGKFTKKGFFENTNMSTRDGRGNRIFDLQWAALTSPETMDKMFNPGGFDPQKKTSRITQLLRTTNIPLEQLQSMSLQDLDSYMGSQSYRNIGFSTNQVYFHKQNMTAAKTIGIFANHNTSHAFLSMQDISLNIPQGKDFYFDGQRVGSTGVSKLDAIVGLNGTSRISKVIAGFLAASVDGAKDPVLNAMNINTFTAGTAMLLARLGFDELSIGLFLTQPSIEKITREYFRLNNEGYMSGDMVIKNELARLADEGYKSSPADLTTNYFTKEMMADNIRNHALGIESKSFDVQSLLLMQRLLEHAKSLNDLTKLTRYNSPTIQPSLISEALVLERQYDQFMNVDMRNSETAPFSKEALDVFNNSPILNAFYNSTIGPKGAQRQIFQDYFPHYSSGFENLMNNLADGMNSDLDAKTIDQLVNFYTLYKLTSPDSIDGEGNIVLDGSSKSRDYYLNQFPRIFEETIQGNIKGNPFLDALRVSPASRNMPVRVINAQVGNYSMEAQEAFSNGWTELLTSSDPQLKRLGLDLVYYNMHRSGLSFNPQTFLHLLSVDGKLAIPGYIEAMRDINYNQLSFRGSDMLHSFKRNFAHEYKIVPTFRPNDNVKVTPLGDGSIRFDFGDDANNMGAVKVKSQEASDPIRFQDYIWYDRQLLKLDGEPSVNRVYYRPTSRLGVQHNAIEVDGNNTVFDTAAKKGMESVVNKTEYGDIIEAQKEYHGEIYDFTNEEYSNNEVTQSKDYTESKFTEQVYRDLMDADILTTEQVKSLKESEGYNEKVSRLNEMINFTKLQESQLKELQNIIDKIC